MSVSDKDKGYKALLVRATDLKQGRVAVGITQAAGEKAHGKTTIIDIAGWQEFGTATIPERSFLRAWFDENEPHAREMVAKLTAQVIAGRLTKSRALELLGIKFVGEIQQRMADRIPPPLAPSTIAAKGSDVPLIDTGQLRSSITYVVGK